MPNWEKRELNRTNSKKILQKAGISFTEHNNGAHLKIGVIDFWPGTGLFRSPDFEGRGVYELIKVLEQLKEGLDDHIVEVNKKVFTVDQLFNIAAHSKNKSLMGICESLHKEIYK